jgi:hypothetical protein
LPRRASAVCASGIRSANEQAKNIRPYGPSTRVATNAGCIGGIESFTTHAAIAAHAAAVHSLTTKPADNPVGPMRAFSARRSKSISIQPARPADAVNPAAPHAAGIPSSRGTGIAHT